MSKYNFYIKQIDSDDDTEYAIGEKFPSFRMKSITGLMISGDPTNSYIETFADTSRVKVFVGKKSAKVGTVKMDTVFLGQDCATDYDSFLDFISEYVLQYRDTYRNKTATLLMSKAPKITNDRRRDNDSLIEATFTFKKIDI